MPESVVSDRGPQFAAELNKMLGIKTKLSTAFHPQTDGQTERMNQELEQYLQFFIENRQKDWPEWLVAAEFAINNKVHMATKVLPFMANYGREMRIEGDIRRKEKVESATEFVEKMKKVHEEAEAALKKTQEEMKRYADRGKKETEKWKKEDRVLLSTKDLVLRSLTMNLTFIFISYFSFSFSFFSFSIFRTTQVRGYQSCCHISHKLMA